MSSHDSDLRRGPPDVRPNGPPVPGFRASADPRPEREIRGGPAPVLARRVLVLLAVIAAATLFGRDDRRAADARAVLEGQLREIGAAAETASGSQAAVAAPPRSPGSGVAPNVSVTRDEAADVVRVQAPNPWAALSGFCTLGQEWEPVGLARPAVPQPNLRYGILRDRLTPDRLAALEIRRDRWSRAWVIGNGRVPVTTVPLGRLRLEEDADLLRR